MTTKFRLTALLLLALTPLHATAASIKESCLAKWANEGYSMVKYCMDTELEAAIEVRAYLETKDLTEQKLVVRCYQKWENESFQMIAYCIKTEKKALSAIGR